MAIAYSLRQLKDMILPLLYKYQAENAMILVPMPQAR